MVDDDGLDDEDEYVIPAVLEDQHQYSFAGPGTRANEVDGYLLD